MKRLAFTLLVCCLAASNGLAQEKEAESSSKIESEANSNVDTEQEVEPETINGFLTDYETAVNRANKNRKPVFVYVFDST